METETQAPAPAPETQDPLQATGADAVGIDGTVAPDGFVPEGAVDLSILDRAYDFLQAGGPVVMILVVMSVISLAIILVKLLQFRNARLNDLKPAKAALGLWRAGRVEEAISVAGKSRNPVAQAIARGLRGHHRGLPDSMIREEVMRYGGDVLQNMRAWFRPLEVIASLAPLLGLFGTVLGMITAFQQLESAGNQVNPAILSGGIWVALLTTAVGLAVAMPVVVILNWLERRVDRLAHNMDNYVTQLFTQDLSKDEAIPASAANSSRQQPRFHTVPALAGE